MSKPDEMELSRIRSGFASPDKMALIMSDHSERLRRMDRYERRALSRRKFAIRAFDAYCVGCTPPSAANAFYKKLLRQMRQTSISLPRGAAPD